MSQAHSFALSDLVIASALTAILPVALALTIYWLAPWGCDASAWLCLFPLALLWVAPVGAIVLPVLVHLNRQKQRPMPDGWLAIMLVTGIIAQLCIAAVSLWMLSDYMREIFFTEALIFPQAFLAGALTGGVFGATLSLRRWLRKRPA